MGGTFLAMLVPGLRMGAGETPVQYVRPPIITTGTVNADRTQDGTANSQRTQARGTVNIGERVP